MYTPTLVSILRSHKTKIGTYNSLLLIIQRLFQRRTSANTLLDWNQLSVFLYFLSIFTIFTIQFNFLLKVTISSYISAEPIFRTEYTAAKYCGMQLQYPVGHVSDLSRIHPCVYIRLFRTRMNLHISVSCRLHRIGTARMRRCVNVKSIFIGWCNPLCTIKLPCKLLIRLLGKTNASVFCFRNIGEWHTAVMKGRC